MRKWRLTKWGQLQQLPEDEMDQAFSNDERWTVRPIFVLAIEILFAVVFFLTMPDCARPGCASVLRPASAKAARPTRK
jgi:hypothetical protein